MDERAKIQIDNLDELLTLGAIAKAKKLCVEVAIRVYADCGVYPVWSKFGFNADTDEALQAIRHIRDNRYLRLVGLHTHVGTFVLDPAIYTRATEKLIKLAASAKRETGCDIAYLNLGGGFASRSQLHFQFLPPENVTPSFDAYAEAICKPILRRWPKGHKLPRLYLETGRAMVDEAGYLITTIVAVKQGAPAQPPAGGSPITIPATKAVIDHPPRCEGRPTTIPATRAVIVWRTPCRERRGSWSMPAFICCIRPPGISSTFGQPVRSPVHFASAPFSAACA